MQKSWEPCTKTCILLYHHPQRVYIRLYPRCHSDRKPNSTAEVIRSKCMECTILKQSYRSKRWQSLVLQLQEQSSYLACGVAALIVILARAIFRLCWGFCTHVDTCTCDHTCMDWLQLQRETVVTAWEVQRMQKIHDSMCEKVCLQTMIILTALEVNKTLRYKWHYKTNSKYQ